MCGILGSYNFPIDFEKLLTQQSHRGPDAQGIHALKLEKNTLQLGHNRLKIVCLDDKANQPFIDETAQHFLVFNGEIYNYRQIRAELEQSGLIFSTESDTEVLLKAIQHWGIEAVTHFNGMFAFAYFNRHTSTLYLVRDRFGVKPLFYYVKQNQLLFASSSQIIAKACHLKPNYAYLKRGLQYGIYEDHTDLTAYEQLQAVPSGHIVKIVMQGQQCQPQIMQYYDLKQRVQLLSDSIETYSESDLFERIHHVLHDATWLRLQADVPVAVALSGGLDSAAIAAISKSQQHSIEAFCFGNTHDRRTEGPLAHKMAKLHGLKLHCVNASANEWTEALGQTIAYQEAPFAGISVVAQFLLYQKIKQHGFKVVLGGQGGDEAFLGYRKFQLFYLNELIQQGNWLAVMHFLPNFARMLWAEKRRLQEFWRIKARYLKKQGQSSKLELPGDDICLNLGYTNNMAERQIADIVQFSLPTLLRYEDRNSMAHSIESRLPFMDYRLIELACALPTALKLKNGYGKWPIRQLMNNKIPNDIRLARNKRGFDVVRDKNVKVALTQLIQDHLPKVEPILQPFIHDNIADYFSYTQLSHIPQRFTELITVLWLAGKSI